MKARVERARIALAEAARKRPVIADGATGSLLDAMLGSEGADRRDLLALERPETAAAVHRAYLASGAEILKTATFNASARGLARFAEAGTAGAEGGEERGFRDPSAVRSDGPAGLARSLNAASAALGRAAVDAATAIDGKPRWVAGSVGPGSDAPSLGSSSYGELRASYLPQFLGLIEGGADLALIETVQDTIQCKAAIGALEEAARLSGVLLPFIASATVDARGRLLSGADPAAFAAVVEPFGPLAIGLNCSGGPDELEAAFEALSAASSAPLCFMPNAGLPRSSGGRVRWPLDAAGFAEKTAAIALRLGAGIIGGCCGTGPEHIAALARAVADAPVPGPRPARVFALASPFAAFAFRGDAAPQSQGSGIFVIDERSNASGSAAFKALVKSGDLDAAARFVIDRASRGARAVDVSVAGAARDEAGALASIVAKASPVAAAALSIDTTDEKALEAALPLVGGRPLVNSVNLEDEAKAARLFALAREYGAAVVCLAMDASGPARDRQAKLGVCRRLYELALSNGLSPEDLLFDTCTFPVASGDRSLAFSAAETIAAVAGLPAACPGSGTVLGVGNSSFGLPKPMRQPFTSRFAAAARRAGLRAAIVDPAALQVRVPEGLADAADAIIEARAGLEGYGEAVERLLSQAEGQRDGSATASDNAGGSPQGGSLTKDPVAGASSDIAKAIIAGDSAAAVAATLAAIGPDGEGRGEPRVSATAPPIASEIAGAMAELGKRYDAGAIALPLVLRSADAARDAFAALRSSLGNSGSAGPRVVLSTVRGDLHDIGKNLVGMVLEAAGFEVIDLGTDRSASDICRAAEETGAVAVGVSGLLTRSLAEMEKVASALTEAGSLAVLLCGGAAVDAEYVAERIAPARPGLARYAKDPFEAVGIVRALGPARAAGAAGEVAASGEVAAAGAGRLPAGDPTKGEQPGVHTPLNYLPPSNPILEAPRAAGPSEAAMACPAFAPPFLGSATMEPMALDELLAALDRRAVIRSRWAYADEAEGSAALEEAIRAVRAAGGVEAACRYGFFKARRLGDDIVAFSDGAGAAASFRFPRERADAHRSVADFFAPEDAGAAFCVTLGRAAVDYLAASRASGDSSAYLRAHGLLAGLAEAAAELAHGRLAQELAGRGASPKGKRYSFGFPGCPGVEANPPLLALLGAAAIGLRATEGYQLEPEFSVTAIVVQRSAAVYISA